MKALDFLDEIKNQDDQMFWFKLDDGDTERVAYEWSCKQCYVAVTLNDSDFIT